jgi:hypothetical protein
MLGNLGTIAWKKDSCWMLAKLLSQLGRLRQNRVFSAATYLDRCHYVVTVLYGCICAYTFPLCAQQHFVGTCGGWYLPVAVVLRAVFMTPFLPNIRRCNGS